MIVGVDIGGHHIAGALVDRGSWSIRSYRHRETDGGASCDDLLDAWSGLIKSVADGARDSVDGIGIAMPGPFDYRTGVAYFEGNGKFECLYGVDVRAELLRRVPGAKEVRFLNDATAFAVGCVGMGEARGRRRVLALTLGTGLGSAFLEDGVPVIEEKAGEVPPHGCVWHLPYKDGIADDYVSSRWILREARSRLGSSVGSVAQVAEIARHAPDARAIFDEYGANLATIVAPWVRGFGVEAILLGGRITRAFDLFSGALHEGLASADAARPVSIHENTEDAAIVGAAMTFDEAFWQQAKTRLPDR